jgi:hypothetical protein
MTRIISKWSAQIFILAIIFSALGCPKKEKITPAGSVPPLAQVQPYQEKEIDTSPLAKISAGTSVSENLDQNKVIEKFKSAYASHKSPRIAILLNRELSDEVSEWKVYQKDFAGVSATVEAPSHEEGFGPKHGESCINAEGKEGQACDTQTGPYKHEAEGGANVEVTTQMGTLYSEPSGERASPGEVVKWKYETGFMQPFIDAKAKVIDRATIIRQIGVDEEKGKMPQNLDRNVIEMDALNKYADVYIELLITSDSSSPTGYIFKATAKNLKTGEVIAQALSTGVGKEKVEKEVVATAHGYEIKNKPKEAPSLEMTSKQLALQLMEQMSKQWSD